MRDTGDGYSVSIRGLVQTGRLRYIPGDGPTAPWLFDVRELDAFMERD